VISFKDLRLVTTDPDDESAAGGDGRATPAPRRSNPSRETPTSSNIDAHGLSEGVNVDNGRLAVIMVGLPARGKTFLCNKLMSYLNWLGHPTCHFNVGNYRREQRGAHEIQDATFFDHNNAVRGFWAGAFGGAVGAALGGGWGPLVGGR
jgi:hypothetical protein